MISTIFTRISASAPVKFFTRQVRRFFLGDSYLKVGSDKINYSIIIFCTKYSDYQGRGAYYLFFFQMRC